MIVTLYTGNNFKIKFKSLSEHKILDTIADKRSIMYDPISSYLHTIVNMDQVYNKIFLSKGLDFIRTESYFTDLFHFLQTKKNTVKAQSK